VVAATPCFKMHHGAGVKQAEAGTMPTQHDVPRRRRKSEKHQIGNNNLELSMAWHTCARWHNKVRGEIFFGDATKLELDSLSTYHPIDYRR
jgi:hypothetical protein